MCEEYGELSTMLYEHTKPAGYSIDGDIEYYLRKLGGVSGRILEAGVGTGRVLIPLVKGGLTVDGVDASEKMLKQCKANLAEHGILADLYEQDLTALSLPHKYEAIIMPTGSFCLLPKAHVRDILAGFYNHLVEGGRLIVDLEIPVDFREGDVTISNFSLSDDTDLVLTSSSEKIDRLTQKISYINKYELVEHNEVTRTEVSDFVLYWYEVTEFEVLLAQAGFEHIEHEAGYGSGQSHIITFIAFRA